MKNFKSGIFFMILALGLASCTQKTKENDVVGAYIGLKNALVADDAAKAKEKAMAMKKEISATKADKLKPGTFNEWGIQTAGINSELDKISQTTDIKVQRAAFSHLSDMMLVDVKKFGLAKTTTYHSFCPMYNDGKGGHWLSETKDIKNPYYGADMLECGADSGEIAPAK